MPLLRNLTNKELEVLNLSVDLWNKFCFLPVIHPDEREEMKTMVHHIQNAIMARPVVERQLHGPI